MPDPRLSRRRVHALIDVLVIGICTLLCGGETIHDMEALGSAKQVWLNTFLKLTHAIPSNDTFNRVLTTFHEPMRSPCGRRITVPESLRACVVSVIRESLSKHRRIFSIP